MASSVVPNPASPDLDAAGDLTVADEWDTGNMGCGEILILLRSRMQQLDPGDVLKLTTRDLGAHEDLPAWCRLTGRRLVRAQHPDYWIEQRRS